MDDIVVKKRSYLYDILSSYDITCSTETKISNMRKSVKGYDTAIIYNGQIDNTICGKSYIIIPVSDLNMVELWFDGTYIDIQKCNLIKTNFNGDSVILLDKLYDDSFVIKYYINTNVVYRATQSGTGNSSSYNMNLKVEKSKVPILDNNFYAIADGKFSDLINISDDDTFYYISILYYDHCDFFICNNLRFAKNMRSNTCEIVTPLDDPIICGTFLFNANSDSILNTKFYPYVGVNEDGFLRVFSDIHTTLDKNNLEYIRHALYPDFGTYDNPYDPFQNPKAGIIFGVDTIYPDDSIDTILTKFSILSKEYYRIIEIIEPDDKLFDIFEDVFTIKEMVIDEYITKVVISEIPYAEKRDILFYKGKVFTDYKSAKIRHIDDQYCEFSDRGVLTQYVMYDDSMDIDKFVIMKICADNNPTIKNIANDIILLETNDSGNKNYQIDLDRRVRTMYDNFLFLRRADFILYEKNDVVLSAKPPNVSGDYSIWFQIMNGINSEEPDFPYDGFVPPIDDSEFKNNRIVGLYLDEETVWEAGPGDIYLDSFAYDKILDIYNDDEAYTYQINNTIRSILYEEERFYDIVDVFIYKDTAMIFRNNSDRIKYNRVFVDLLNSGLTEHRKLMIFNSSLVDNRHLDGVHLEAQSIIDTVIDDFSDDTIRNSPDVSYVYSNNIRRISIYREDLNVSDLKSLDINRMVNLTSYGIYFDKKDFMVYINGDYIKKSDILETTRNRFMVNYIGQINRIDIIYNSYDDDIHKLKNVIA